MLKKLATAYIKKQWGNNMKKFAGMQLPGGITMNGQQIFDEAVKEIYDLEKEIRDTYKAPATVPDRINARNESFCLLLDRQ
jgi:hypothetical protein